VSASSAKLTAALTRHLSQTRLTLASSARALAAVSPLNTLHRGYSVLTRSVPGRTQPATVSSVLEAEPGQQLHALLADGRLELTVTGIDDDPPLKPPDLEITA